MRYNLLNLPEEYVAASGDRVRYVYSADGEKLYVLHTTAVNDTTGTEYAANYRIENGSVTMIHTDAGYYTRILTPAGVTGPLYTHIWYLRDHLGNNRVLADDGGNAIALHDYDPYGEEISVAFSSLLYPFPPGGRESPYKYGGKEWTSTTSTYDFEARQMAPAFHRFTTMDPLAEKYYSISPNAYCAGNPVNIIDSGGDKIVFVNGLLACGSPEGGSKYWGGERSSFVEKAKTILSDNNVVFLDVKHDSRSLARSRFNAGYQYAKENLNNLVSDMEEGESFKFITHSMGAAYAEGIASLLLEQGHSVEMMLHFSPYQAVQIKTVGERPDILTISYRTLLDPVLLLDGIGGNIQGADYTVLDFPSSDLGHLHRESINSSASWEQINSLIQAFLTK